MSRPLPSESLSRRELLRAIGRGVAAAGLGALVGLLFARGKVRVSAGTQGGSCPSGLLCARCPASAACQLPARQILR